MENGSILDCERSGEYIRFIMMCFDLCVYSTIILEEVLRFLHAYPVSGNKLHLDDTFERFIFEFLRYKRKNKLPKK